MDRAPRQWPGETVVCLGSGPSLRREDVESCRGRARVIAVNDAVRLAPWADVLYASDASWWVRAQAGKIVDPATFPGQMWSIEHRTWAGYIDRFPQVRRLKNTGVFGVDINPTGLRDGRNSGYVAINLAVHFGAARIVLLGYDMQSRKGSRAHFFDDTRAPRSPYPLFLQAFETMAAPLQQLGLTVVNASRETALACFPRMTLDRALTVEALA